MNDHQNQVEYGSYEITSSEGWEGEINRKSRPYIRWIQRSLNKLLGLRLAVDGIAGRMTRSAVRDFQKRFGLLVDGIVGPQTERALIKAGAGSPPTSATPIPAKPFDTPSLWGDKSPEETLLGTLTVTDPAQLSFSYRFTTEDASWIAKMIIGEAGGRDDRDNEAVIWAMFNRYAFFTHKNYSSFTKFIRAYSTPIQPYLRNCSTVRHHMKRSQFVRLGGTLNNKKCPDLPKGQLDRHLKLQKKPWYELPLRPRSLAERAVKGQISNPICTASEFASTYTLFRRRYGYKPDEEAWHRYTMNFKRSRKFKWIGEMPGLNQKKNAFFTRTLRIPGTSLRYSDLPCDTVVVVPPS